MVTFLVYGQFRRADLPNFAGDGALPRHVRDGVVLFGGWVLCEVLIRAATHRGDDQAELCAALAVTQGYWSSLSKGIRDASSLSDTFLRACAAYLEVPVLLVQIVAGKISPEDLVEIGVFAGTDMSNVIKAARTYTMVRS